MELKFDTKGTEELSKAIEVAQKKVRDGSNAAAKELDADAKRIGGGFDMIKDKMLGVATAMMGPVGIIDLFKRLADTAAGLGKLGRDAADAGMSPQHYKQLGDAVRLFGGDADTAKASMMGLQMEIAHWKQTGNSGISEVMNRIGASMNSSAEETLAAYNKFFQTDHTFSREQKVNMGLQLGLSKDLVDEVAANKLDEFKEKVKGFVPTDEEVKRATEFNQALARFQMEFGKGWMDLTAAIEPTLTTILNFTSDFLDGKSSGFREAVVGITTAIASFVSYISTNWVIRKLLGLGSGAAEAAAAPAAAAEGEAAAAAAATGLGLPAAAAAAGIIGAAAGGKALGDLMNDDDRAGIVATMMDETGTPVMWKDKKTGEAVDPAERQKRLNALPKADAATPAPASSATSANPTDRSQWGAALKADLMKTYNLTANQAAGIVGNLAHESGDFKHLQEINPLGGGRGGLGIAQWTGSRRRDYEAWAKANNLDVNSYEANAGFLKHELNTNYARTLAELKRTNSLSEAVSTFEKSYEGAGVVAMDSRLRRAQRFASNDDVYGGTRNNSPTNITHDRSVDITTLNVHTAAADTKSIARDIHKELAKQIYQDTNTGLV